jgi:hypothetical protein
MPDTHGGRVGIDRRTLLGAAALGLVSRPARALAARSPAEVAREGLQRHAARIAAEDMVGIADFAAPSRLPRFFLVDMAAGTADALLVSHGRGSDPAHRGWVERFSNHPGSFASSAGAYLTGEPYVGRHGRSQRLVGLDPENSNAEVRAIVIHGAWYVSPDMVARYGKLGRSEGCFAFSDADLATVLARLGPGRLLYAGKFGIAT